MPLSSEDPESLLCEEEDEEEEFDLTECVIHQATNCAKCDKVFAYHGLSIIFVGKSFSCCFLCNMP